MIVGTVFVAVPCSCHSCGFGVGLSGETRVDTDARFPLITRKTSLFLRVRVNKLIWVFEGEFPQSVLNVRLFTPLKNCIPTLWYI